MEIRRVSAFKAFKFGIINAIDHIGLVLISLLAVPFLSISVGLLSIGAMTLTQYLLPRFAFDAVQSYIPAALPFSAFLFRGAIFYLLVTFVGGLYLGLFRIYLDICRKQDSSLSSMFNCFSFTPRVIGAYLCYITLVSLGLSLLVVPGIIVAVRLQFAKFFILEKNAGIIDSLRLSYGATKGYFWSLFALWILQWICYISVILFPVFGLAYTKFYCELTK